MRWILAASLAVLGGLHAAAEDNSDYAAGVMRFDGGIAPAVTTTGHITPGATTTGPIGPDGAIPGGRHHPHFPGASLGSPPAPAAGPVAGAGDAAKAAEGGSAGGGGSDVCRNALGCRLPCPAPKEGDKKAQTGASTAGMNIGGPEFWLTSVLLARYAGGRRRKRRRS